MCSRPTPRAGTGFGCACRDYAARMDLRVISIGTLAANPLWNERTPVRTGHATTTLIRDGSAVILVDPGLPAQILVARLGERAGIGPEAVTHVFLTSFHPEARRGLEGFERAEWLISQDEREAVGVGLIQQLQRSEEDAGVRTALEREIALLHRCQAAPDRITPAVHLFPLHGQSPGLTGLLLPEAARTVLVCGDAAPTVEHIQRGQVLPSAVDVTAAKESLGEAVEIADLLVPGRDNLCPSPLRSPFDR